MIENYTIHTNIGKTKECSFYKRAKNGHNA